LLLSSLLFLCGLSFANSCNYPALPPHQKISPQSQHSSDASLKAIESHVKSGAEMVLYSVNAISGSTESQGEVTVRLQNSGRVVNGVGSDPDIVVASAKAYLSALNKLQSKADRVAAQG
jgi:2-isopropylmalate synthase